MYAYDFHMVFPIKHATVINYYHKNLEQKYFYIYVNCRVAPENATMRIRIIQFYVDTLSMLCFCFVGLCTVPHLFFVCMFGWATSGKHTQFSIVFNGEFIRIYRWKQVHTTNLTWNVYHLNQMLLISGTIFNWIDVLFGPRFGN